MNQVIPQVDAKILVALSGGVDSAMTALQLVKAGYQVEAAYMKNWINEENILGHCPWQEDIEDARKVSEYLNVPFRVLNFIDAYRERIVQYLVEGYARGITPNPDVLCNREMKFGILLQWALENGFDYVATGHYARRVDPAEGGEPELHEGIDPNKDQSYFLSLLKPEQLHHALFPIGHLQKSQLRRLAVQEGLPNAGKKDSQGICFVGEVKINDFLEHYIDDQPGNIVDRQGKVLGQHRGLHRYTLGQRRGLGIPSNRDHEFYVVVAKNLESKELVVALESERASEIWHEEILLHQLSWIGSSAFATEERQIDVKVRYRDPRIPARIRPEGDSCYRLIFEETQRALASGQICALYDGSQLLGGGVYL